MARDGNEGDNVQADVDGCDGSSELGNCAAVAKVKEHRGLPLQRQLVAHGSGTVAAGALVRAERPLPVRADEEFNSVLPALRGIRIGKKRPFNRSPVK